MALIAYERDIPATPNNPSVDQPDMKDNTNHIDDIIAVDHYSFNNNNSGWHKQVTLPIASPFAAPSTNINQGVLYTNTINSATNLFYKNDGVADQYQITRTNSANFPLFSNNTNNYNGVGANFSGGWTFLPGGMLYQYGTFDQGVGGITPSIGTVTFPIAFASAANVTVVISPISKVGGTGTNNTFSVISGTISTTSFQWNASTSGSAYRGITWFAIGK